MDVREVPRDMTGRPLALRPVDFGPFFRPRTVAVIGASDTPHRPNTVMWRKLRAKVEADGAVVYPVHPTKPVVDGLATVADVRAIPGDGPLDLAVILVGDALAVLPAVVERGCRFAVVFAADFAEVGPEGEERQRRLAEVIADSGTRLLGPNTNMNAFETFRDDLPGRAIALVTQSGHQGRPVFQGQEIGIRLSHWAPVGNEVDLEFADFTAWFADQPEVGVVAAYLEGFKDGRTVQLALDHCARRKVAVVAVKVGRTREGSATARAHTGHLTGEDAVVGAVFRQFGVTRVDGLDELLDVSAALARTPPPPPGVRGVCVYSISGGTGAHMADLAATAGLELVTLAAETQARLREHIPGYLQVSNPVDSGGAPSGDARGKRILDAILSDPGVAALICPITGAGSMANRLAKDLVVTSREHGKAVFVVWGSPVGTETAYTDILLPSELPVFRTFANAVTAVRAYFDTHAFHDRYRSPFQAAPPVVPAGCTALARAVLRPGAALSEHDSKAVVAAYGIPVTRDLLAGSAAEAAAAAERLGGSVVLKICSSDIAHKSELGLVRIGVRGAAEVRRAYDELVAAAAAGAPGARLDGVLVSEQLSGGVEMVAGVARDPLFGPVVMAGSGGVLVEVLRDVTHRVPPFDAAEARRMLAELAGARLFAGVRGGPAVDAEAFVDLLVRLGWLAQDLDGQIAEVDLNPVLVRAQGAVALDALVVCR
ncbi:MAG: acetate--CoA ligase family protein [Mycobacteriales bacterium]